MGKKFLVIIHKKSLDTRRARVVGEGGNETHSHLAPGGSPARTTLGIFETLEKQALTIEVKLEYNFIMKVLVGCEFSGIVRDCFSAMGHDAVSCDILPSDSPHGVHYQGDVIDVLYNNEWDLAILHPPCTYLASSGLHWNKRVPGRSEKTEEALRFITTLWNAPVEKMAIENPVGCINTRLDFMPKPQYVQPYNFGEDASKKTGLWIRGLPFLEPTEYIEPRMVDGKPRWGNQGDTGYDKFGGGQGHERSKTFFGIAAAMADQWGS